MSNLFERLSKERPPAAEKVIEQPQRQEDPIASTILRTLRQTRPGGLNRRAIFGLLYRNHNAAKIDAALDKLWREGKVRREQRVRTRLAAAADDLAEVWFATPHE